MQEIPLLAVANQTLTIDLDARQWTITIKEAGGCMVADLNVDGEDVVTGARILAGEPVIPYAYLQRGNLVLVTVGDALPYWDQFGVSQSLLFLTDDEMATG